MSRISILDLPGRRLEFQTELGGAWDFERLRFGLSRRRGYIGHAGSSNRLLTSLKMYPAGDGTIHWGR